MKTIRYFNTMIDNRAVVEEERQGFAREFAQKHQTTIADPDVRNSIRHMSILEITS